jgi:hypothetical protein
MSVGLKLTPVPKAWDPDVLATLEARYRACQTFRIGRGRSHEALYVPDLTGAPIGTGPFGSAQVRSLTGLTSRQVRYWRYTGLVVPSVQATGGKPGKPALYSAEDVATLRGIKARLDAGCSTQAIHKAVRH